MKLTMTGKLLALSIAAMAFAVTGCSGGQEDDEKLEVTDEEAEAQGSAEASDSANGEAAEGETETAAEGEEASEPTEEVAQDTPAEEVPTPTDATASAGGGTGAGIGTSPAAAGGTVDTGRVVRYVNASVAPLLNAASTSAGNVGQLVKGERVMVVIEGTYARIADGMFIKVDHLSAKPVARERKDAVWQAPAH